MLFQNLKSVLGGHTLFLSYKNNVLDRPLNTVYIRTSDQVGLWRLHLVFEIQGKMRENTYPKNSQYYNGMSEKDT